MLPEIKGTYSQIMTILEDLIPNDGPAFEYSKARRFLILHGRLVHDGTVYIVTGGL
jgi:hypothetical protein